MARASELFATGVSNHAALTGLGADDHPQYLTAARGDARYYSQGDVDAALAAKSDTGHGHALSGLSDVSISAVGAGELLVWSGDDFQNMTLAEAGVAPASHSHTWASITGKPSSFTPSAHAHAVADVSGLQTALDGKAATSHGHALGDLSNVVITSVAGGHVLQWDAGSSRFVNRSLADAGIAATGHGHSKADVGLGNVDNTADADKPISTAMQAALDAKAGASHGHAIAAITGLQTALDGKAGASHGHSFSSLTGKPTTLAGYGITDAASAGHGHAWSEITGKPSSFAPSAHGHPISDVTGLQAALDAKADFDRVIVSDAHTAQPEQVVAVITTGAAITITAPASPAENTYFFVGDAGANAEANNITVEFGAETYNGTGGETFKIDVNEFGTGFLFAGGTWRMLR